MRSKENTEYRNDVKIGFCRFCGVSRILPETKGTTQQEWDEEATNDCNCKEAQNVRWKTAVLEQFGDDMGQIDISPKIRTFLSSGAELIADGVLEYVQIRTDRDATVKVTKKSGGIFLRKTTTNTEELLSDGVYR